MGSQLKDRGIYRMACLPLGLVRLIIPIAIFEVSSSPPATGNVICSPVSDRPAAAQIAAFKVYRDVPLVLGQSVEQTALQHLDAIQTAVTVNEQPILGLQRLQDLD